MKSKGTQTGSDRTTADHETDFPSEKPFSPLHDPLFFAAVITAAAVTAFGVMILVFSILNNQPASRSPESVGWSKITAFFMIVLYAAAPVFCGVTALLFARSASARYRKIRFRDGECKTRILLSFLFDVLGMLIPLIFRLVLSI